MNDDPRAARRSAFALSACMFLITGAWGFVQPMSALYLRAAGLSDQQIGWVAGGGTALALLAQPVLGRLSDLLDARRPLMVAVALAGCAAYLLFLRASGPVPFALLTALGVTCNLYLNAAGGVLVGRLAAREGAGGAAAYARFRVWGSVGFIVVALGVGLLAQRLSAGARTAGRLDRATLGPVFVAGSLLFAAIAASALFVPDPKRAAAGPREGTSGPEQASIAEEGAAAGVPPALRAYLLAQFLFFLAFNGALTYLSLFLERLGAPPLGITATWAGGVVCEAIVMSRIGRIADRYGRRPALLVAFAVLPVRLVLYSLAPGPLAVAAVQTMEAFNYGIIGIVSVAFVNDHAPEHARGAAQARLAAVTGLALALAPLLAGAVAEALGLRGMFATLAGVATAGALVLWLRVPESHPAPERLPGRLFALLGTPPRMKGKTTG
jgi:PPP family 3-phenylpropionic acid transporter